MLGADAIAAELARDATDAGERNAATCRAMIPTEEAKRAAWELLTGGELTIAMFRAVLSGFADMDQLTDQAACCGAYWRLTGTYELVSAMEPNFVAENITLICPLTAKTVAVTDAYLADDSVPTGLRRLLSEGRDDVRRCLRCQARDQQA